MFKHAFAAAGLALLAAGPVAAQSTLTLTDGNATTLRGGSYASTNFGSSHVLETRASSDATYARRALFKFDTHTTIPRGTPIARATLTVTVASGSDGETRQLSAFNEPDSYDEFAATWNSRKSGLAWSQAGGDLGSRYASATVPGTAGTRVAFDVTSLVAAVVRGDFNPTSRYTHILLIDQGASSRTSYKAYYSDEASDPSVRPTLTIVTGTSASTTSTSSSGSTGQTLTLTNGYATTLRGGSYASTNFGSAPVLETRASGDATYIRRALFKFDTHAIPMGTPIAEATLTLTVANGSDGETRQLSAFNEPDSYDESAATWNSRKSGMAWSQPGGAVGSRYAVATVTGTAGSRVGFDVTQLVAAVVRGDFDPNSRYTHILVMDEGASSQTSYKAYDSNDAADASVRPTLTIVTGASTSSSSTSTSSSSSTSSSTSGTTSGTATLRVLQWNTHHGGYGTDGVLNQNRLATWAASFKPDVVMFNEIELNDYWGHVNGPEVYKALLEQKTGKTWYYTFAQEFGQWGSSGKGNLILSRIPFNSTTHYELANNNDRSAAEANITVNGRSITLISTHIDPDNATLRLTQATEIVNWAAGEPENRILTGDMNAWPDQSSIAEFDTRYDDSWVVAQSQGTALAFSGNSGQTKNGRIDYIFYSKNANLSVKSSQVYDTRDANGVMPSDHRPLLTVFTVK